MPYGNAADDEAEGTGLVAGREVREVEGYVAEWREGNGGRGGGLWSSW